MTTSHNLRPAVARKLAKELRSGEWDDFDHQVAAWKAVIELAEDPYATTDEVADLLDPPKPPAKRARKHKETNNG